MDKKTIDVYDRDASRYVADWMSQPEPEEIHAIVKRFFERGALTADIGCGSGRDAGWLMSEGYPCTGYDASEGLLEQARKLFPALTFARAELPHLTSIADASYTNVLCETVLQHLPVDQHVASLKNLMRITRKGGTLSLSVRHPLQSHGDREKDERLYVKADAAELVKCAAEKHFALLYRATICSASSGKTITQLVFRS